MGKQQQESEGSGRKVVVIGGGIGGSFLAKAIQFIADVTLIDSKEYFEIPWAGFRAMMEPPFAERSLIYHKDYIVNGRIVTSDAINVTENEVLTKDGNRIAYDYLVIATGHKDPVPESRSERLDQFKTENEKIKSAQSILIVGGGPTGVELAGEIAVDFPDKKVTLVHKGSRLLEFIGPKAGHKTLDWLVAKNVDVKLGQTVDLNSISDGDNTYVTSAGESIKADCHFLCIGNPVGSEWLKDTILKNNLDSHGRLMVDENLRVKGQKNIFAVGDITDIAEMKQAYMAQKHAAVVTKNLNILMSGGNESKLATYRPQAAIAIVSLGRKEGVAQFPFMTTIGCIPGLIKSRDLFVGRTRKVLGLK